MKITVKIAGAAGEGINTIQVLLERMLLRNGYHFISYKDYMSRVRGGLNISTITISNKPLQVIETYSDYLIALSQEAEKLAEEVLKEKGQMITFDEEALKEAGQHRNRYGMAALGYLAKVLGLEQRTLEEVHLSKWSSSVLEKNNKSMMFGYEAGKKAHKRPDDLKDYLRVTGNEALALGALASGLSFYSAYPMAPSTGILTYLSHAEEEMGIGVMQAEDEIAAVMSALGAASNGVRAMTGTSGGGFSLMVEALGFAGVAEIPIVMANVQRPGPATGLPTRTEQGDLLFMAFASQGEFPRVIIAPKNVTSSFYLTTEAFNIAEEYQVPVILLTDQHLADTAQCIPSFDLEAVEIRRGLQEEKVEAYKRYDFTRLKGGRKFPGMDKTLIMTDSHTHDEFGKVDESIETAIALKEKFLKRQELLLEELPGPLYEGPDHPEEIIISWGSTYGAIKEAIREVGEDMGHLHYEVIYPLSCPPEIAKRLEKAKCYGVENNGTGQFSKLLQMETGIRVDEKILSYDGRPMLAEWLVKALKEVRS